MMITLPYFAGCPNWRPAEERLRTTLASAGVASRAGRLPDLSPLAAS